MSKKQGSHKPTDKDLRQMVQEYQDKYKGGRDSRKQFSQAGHQARNDAVGTPYEVRPPKP